jgi:hypothetical protein
MEMTERRQKPHQFISFEIKIDLAFLREGGNLHGLVLGLMDLKNKERTCMHYDATLTKKRVTLTKAR